MRKNTDDQVLRFVGLDHWGGASMVVRTTFLFKGAGKEGGVAKKTRESIYSHPIGRKNTAYIPGIVLAFRGVIFFFTTYHQNQNNPLIGSDSCSVIWGVNCKVGPYQQ